MAMTCMTVVLSVLVLYMFHHDSLTSPPSWLKSFAHGCLARFICHKSKRKPKPDELLLDCTQMNHLSLPREEGSEAIHSDNTTGPKMYDIYLRQSLGEITGYIRNKEKRHEEAEALEDVKQQWREIALIFDSFFFYFFLGVLIIGSPVILGAVPVLTPGKRL